MNAVKRFFDSTAFLGLVQYRVIVILVAATSRSRQAWCLGSSKPAH